MEGAQCRLLVLVAALAVSSAFLSSSRPAFASGSCPNEGFRAGPSASAQLPDCRVYELVTPADSNGRLFGDATPGGSFNLFPFELASPLRDSLVFSVEGSSLQTPPGGGGLPQKDDVYEAERTGSGWSTIRHVTPFPYEAIQPQAGGISADHKYTFTYAGPSTVQPGAELGSLYMPGGAEYLGNAEGHFELTGVGSLGSEHFAQGRYISPGGDHVIFTTGKSSSGSNWCNIALSKGFFCAAKQLEPEAPPTGTGAVYDRAADGPTHVVSLLPGELTPGAGEDAEYQGASRDGTAIAFKIKGTLYLRIHSGEVGATTLKVTEEKSSFGGLSDDGIYLFYVIGGDIHRFDTETKADVEVNTSGDGQMVNVSADGSHVYFISHKQLDGSKGTAGEPNLYAWSGGSPEYVATVLSSDLEGNPALGNWVEKVASGGSVLQSGPGNSASRLTPNGTVVIFESRAQLTPYDNAGHIEIYRYEEGESLMCVSCNPDETPATADAGLQNLDVAQTPIAIPNLSEDGRRVFFETEEALVSADTDGINDVYEWQLPEGEGEAETHLISSGHSLSYPAISENEKTHVNSLLGVTPDGRDVFFLSQDALTPEAGVGGAPAIYDARIDGGFAQPPAPAICLEEGCKPPATPPPLLGSAGSAALQGGGNVTAQKKAKKRKSHAHRCRRRGQHRRCAHRHRSHGGAYPSVAGSGGVSGAGPDAQDYARDTVSTSAGTRLVGKGTATPEASGTGEYENFGIKAVAAETSPVAAAEHPDFTTELVLNKGVTSFSARAKDVAIELPPGLIGNPNLLPRCGTGALLGGACPVDSQVGISKVNLLGIKSTVPVFNLAPVHPNDEVARFGFMIIFLPTFIDISVDTAGDYGVTATVHDAATQFPLVSAKTTFWGDPGDSVHDPQRMTAAEAFECNGTACKAPEGKRSTEELGPIAFMSNPSACQEQEVGFAVTSYQLPGRLFSAGAPLKTITECEGLPFAPALEARPTTDVAGAPTGLHTKLTIPQSSDPSVPSTATMREAKVTLPEGLTINPAAADGLAACSDEQVHFHEEADANCPDASKLGTAAISSPDLPRPLEGALYQRTPGGKGNQFGLWLVSDDLGLHIKIPGEVKPDPATGQLTAVFSDLPQVPVSEVELDVWGGARAPLKNPDACGTYETTSALTPWSNDPAATPSDHYEIDRAPGGGPCPTSADAEPNSPSLEAGTETPISATYSPLLLRVRREDGSQPFANLNLTLPPGLVGKLAGLGQCSDAALAAAANRTGAEEQANPSCPASSLIGSVHAAAGAGPHPYWVTGKAYLAGPYQGAPLSVAVITPALAGPFDLGTVVARSGAYLDPRTAQITVKAALPTILEGVPLDIRTIAVDVDREGFTLNGTDCEPLSFGGSMTSTLGHAAPLSAPFQLAECARLPFKPKLTLAFKGSTKRGSHPVLTADLKARPGDANIGRTQVKLPHAVFLDQSHLADVCTRVQFAADECPARSVYGTAWATSPLLDYKVSGSVYLRSSDHVLPDLVIKLKGPDSQPLEFDLVGKNDSVKGALRNTFEVVPDVPVDRFHLQLFGGGKQGLIELSDGLCKNPGAAIHFRAQNGRLMESNSIVRTSCPKKHKHHKHRR